MQCSDSKNPLRISAAYAAHDATIELINPAQDTLHVADKVRVVRTEQDIVRTMHVDRQLQCILPVDDAVDIHLTQVFARQAINLGTPCGLHELSGNRSGPCYPSI